jgi:hypothetical protein
MPYTEDQVREELKKQGISTIDDLAKQVAKQSADKAKSGAPAEPDYLWSGRNYSIYHPEPVTPPKKLS